MQVIRFARDGSTHIGIRHENDLYEVPTPDDDSIPPVVAVSTNPPLLEDAATVDEAGIEILAPVARPEKIVCLGLNYADHADEGGYDVPDDPMLFSKAPTAVHDPGASVVHPHDIDQLDYEAELAIVVGREGRRIPEADAFDYVAGITAFNDVTARDVQYSTSQFFRGKSYDTFAPMGPGVVPVAEGDLEDLRVRATVNGEVRQDSSTAEMIFSLPEVIASVSATMTLRPGDIIATGTPPGVGVHREPPLLLEPGDEVVIEIGENLRLVNDIVAEK